MEKGGFPYFKTNPHITSAKRQLVFCAFAVVAVPPAAFLSHCESEANIGESPRNWQRTPYSKCPLFSGYFLENLVFHGKYLLFSTGSTSYDGVAPCFDWRINVIPWDTAIRQVRARHGEKAPRKRRVDCASMPQVYPTKPPFIKPIGFLGVS